MILIVRCHWVVIITIATDGSVTVVVVPTRAARP